MSWSGPGGPGGAYPRNGRGREARAPWGGRYLSLAQLGIPRARMDLSVLGAALFLAFLMHVTGLFAYIVLSPSVNRDNYAFFSDVQLVAHKNVDVVQLPKPKPPPPPVAQKPPPSRVPAQPSIKTDPAPAPAPSRKVANPSRNPAPTSQVPTRPVRNPQTALPVLASNKGTGRPVAVGNGGGDPRGIPGGTGQGPAGNGPGGNGPGGNGSGGTSGGTGGAAVAPGEQTTSISLYDSWAAIGVSRPLCAVELHSWEDVCRITNIQYQELVTRAHVPPFFTHAGNPELRDQEQLNGRSGVVHVRAVISASGAPRAEIMKSSGDRLMDKIGTYIAQNSRWLPAMNYGKPVEDTVEYDISFTSAGR